MDEAALLTEAFGRIKQVVHRAVDGLDDEQLAHRVEGRSNSVAWLVWHLTRIQDDHVADVAGRAQVWHAVGWADRFDLPLDPDATGYGHSGDEVAADDLDRVVDTNWNPPVTLGVRLISVVSDDLQHAGQAALVRGML
jgi:hypothetical protein